MPDVTWVDVLLRIGVAALLTGAIGLERELRERAAGLRTHMLVGVGSALFTVVSAYGFAEFRYGLATGITLDPSRVAAQIVTGIGFLGAGAIIRQGITVRGLTTAAGLWVVAAIGMAAGAGYYSAAAIATAVVLVGLGPMRLVEGGLVGRARRGIGTLEVDLHPGRAVAPVLHVLEERQARVATVELAEEEDRRSLRVGVVAPDADARDLLEAVAARDEVVGVRWRA